MNLLVNVNKGFSMIKLISILLLCSSVFADIPRETLYECIDNKINQKVDRIFINTYKKGSKVYHEAVVHYYLDFEERVFTRRLNFLSEYDGNLITYSRGGTIVKIYKALGRNQKYNSFVRLPDLAIHSKNWTCKGYYL